MKKSKLMELDEPLPPPKVSKLRIDFDDHDVSPQLVRGLLARYGRVDDVTVYSGVRNGEDFCYALADMRDEDARYAFEGLDRTR